MQAQLLNEGEITIVRLLGYIDFETAAPFRRTCLEVLKENKVILDFSQLQFVGSSGISIFLETLLEFHTRSPRTIKLCSVGSEFRRILASGDLARLEIYESPTQALLGFQTGVVAQPTIEPLFPQEEWSTGPEGSDDLI